MNYVSTRSAADKKYTSAQVIKIGLAADKGLFLPETVPQLTSSDIESLRKKDYSHRAADILSMYLTDYTYDELVEDCTAAYSEESFPNGAAPIVNVHDNVYSLELWHGPTAAFKDMALQVMPRLLVRALKKTGEDRTALILVATSGDTGKAALEGYRDINGVKISVFYPVDGVSRVQKLQMASQKGNNVNVYAIKGNFDDAQNGVKKLFADADFIEKLNKKGYFPSSANSINWGRLVPQIVYYVSAYCDLINEGKIVNGDKINVCVPTGNFGNIFAAYLAKNMGLPINKLICASNVNNILTDFLATGTYDRRRDFHCTMSPSMDILISSNLERLLYLVCGSEKTKQYMESLSNDGYYTITPEEKAIIDRDFIGYFTNEDETAATVHDDLTDNSYLHDTHTAVAIDAANKYIKESGETHIPMIVDSTASPYKFAADVLRSVTGKEVIDPIEALDELSELTNTDIPYPLKNIGKREVRFKTVIEPNEMKDTVLSSL